MTCDVPVEKMVTEYAVFCEPTSGGGPMMMRRGFASREAAEEHPVIMSHWKRVWVDTIKAKPEFVDKPPPFPWTVLWVSGHSYIVDADGRKIASLLGSQKRREIVAGVVCDLKEPEGYPR